MESLFYLHIGLAYVSLILLLARGILSAKKVAWRQYKLLKIAPHIVDSFLLASGIGIFVWFELNLQPWMFAKLFFLVMYILFASRAFKKNQPFSLKNFVLAVISFMMTMLVAVVK